MINDNLLKDLEPYIKNNEVFRTLVEKIIAGKTDAEIAQGWDVSPEKVADERRRWGIYRDNECPNCGDENYDGKVCGNSRCFSNWVLPEISKK